MRSTLLQQPWHWEWQISNNRFFLWKVDDQEAILNHFHAPKNPATVILTVLHHLMKILEFHSHGQQTEIVSTRPSWNHFCPRFIIHSTSSSDLSWWILVLCINYQSHLQIRHKVTSFHAKSKNLFFLPEGPSDLKTGGDCFAPCFPRRPISDRNWGRVLRAITLGPRGPTSQYSAA